MILIFSKLRDQDFYRNNSIASMLTTEGGLIESKEFFRWVFKAIDVPKN
jgi:hypothetical protein